MFFVFPACLLGCTRTISYQSLSAKIERDPAPALTYRGSDDEAHHFRYVAYAGPHFLPQPIRTRNQSLKIPRCSAKILDEFPLTEDDSFWIGWNVGVYGREPFDQVVRPVDGD